MSGRSTKSDKLNLQIWVDHFLQSKHDTIFRAAMIAQLRKEVTKGCVQIKRLTLAESGIAAYQTRTTDALELNDAHAISVTPLERLVKAGEIDAVRVFLLRLDVSIAPAVKIVDEAPEAFRADPQALLAEALVRNNEFTSRVNKFRQ